MITFRKISFWCDHILHWPISFELTYKDWKTCCTKKSPPAKNSYHTYSKVYMTFGLFSITERFPAIYVHSNHYKNSKTHSSKWLFSNTWCHLKLAWQRKGWMICIQMQAELLLTANFRIINWQGIFPLWPLQMGLKVTKGEHLLQVLYCFTDNTKLIW